MWNENWLLCVYREMSGNWVTTAVELHRSNNNIDNQRWNPPRISTNCSSFSASQYVCVGVCSLSLPLCVRWWCEFVVISHITSKLLCSMAYTIYTHRRSNSSRKPCTGKSWRRRIRKEMANRRCGGWCFMHKRVGDGRKSNRLTHRHTPTYLWEKV